MKKAIAISCMCFLMSLILASCGNKNNNSNNASSDSEKTTTSIVTTSVSDTTSLTTSHTKKTTDRKDENNMLDPDSGNVSENGVMPDESSPLEVIPDVIETAASDAGDIVSDVVDDLT